MSFKVECIKGRRAILVEISEDLGYPRYFSFGPS